MPGPKWFYSKPKYSRPRGNCGRQSPCTVSMYLGNFAPSHGNADLAKKKGELVGIMLIWEYHLRMFMRLGDGHGGREEGQMKENRIKSSTIVVNTE